MRWGEDRFVEGRKWLLGPVNEELGILVAWVAGG